ncbi:MAG: FUSC family protein [Pseudonocardia sp.]|uniref:FUSC family protein n=1 Tax=unclassified Pseudonocardia TaxID=2619320 RepID=UPI000AE8452B|nr:MULTISPECIES: FUSC family protein [unclassified Pseudonocardia]MBN9113473.1 FUSC family protein [Pseudonocardia sp.]
MPPGAWLRELRTEVRTTLTGVDPGLGRLRMAATATAAMVLAALVMAGVRALTGQPVTVLLFAAVVAMIANLSVNEPELPARRLTTALMLLPAAAAITAGTLLAPTPVLADIVFVLVMAGAVWVRRFGPRGFALGMAAFMPYFFTQFLQASAAELPWLLLAAVVGIGSTLLLRGWLLAEKPERVLERLVRAFRARVHAVVEAVGDVLAEGPGPSESDLAAVRRARVRLNDTALQVVDQLEHLDRDSPSPGDLPLRVVDTELATERLAIATRRLLQEDPPPDRLVLRSLAAGMRGLSRATATPTPAERVPALLDGARRSVDTLAADTDGASERAQRVAFAITRLADALGEARDSREAADAGPADADEPADEDEVKDDGAGGGLELTTRQAVQVLVATSLAIVGGELISPSRWYWAVIAAFIVFAGTASRGDVLNRGAQRVVGTIGGVIAGMGLAALVGDQRLVAIVLLFACVFLALYLVRISQALMAFWITTVLALLYGLIGQFSAGTLLVRIEETAVGAALGMLAGYLVLPKRTREAFGEALDAAVDASDAALDAAVARLTGRDPSTTPVELARDLDESLATLRARVKPLGNPLPRRRGRSSYERALRVLTAVDHYVRDLARTSDSVVDPDWEPTLRPAADRVRANLDGLRDHLVAGITNSGRGAAIAPVLGSETGSIPRVDTVGPPAEIVSAEDLVDAAEGHAARCPDHRRRVELLAAVRYLRRIDQAVVGLAVDLGAVPDPADFPAPTPH